MDIMKYSWLRVLTLSTTASITLVACHAAPPDSAARPIVVAGPRGRAEFTARQSRGIGRFITDSVLHANQTLPLTTVLRFHLLGIGRALDTQRIATTSINDRCVLDVFVNGTRATDPLDAIRPADLAGVEYYDRFNVPEQYRRTSSPCDVLLLWTK
jgi:hypothetical protein